MAGPWPRSMEEPRQRRAQEIREGALGDAALLADLHASLTARADGDLGVPLRQLQAQEREQRSA